MTVRTDIHRPSAPEFDPEAYTCVGVFDMHPEEGDRRANGETLRGLLDRGFRFGAGSSSQCGHCGAHIRYAALMVHEASKTFIYVGETCLDNRFDALTKAEFHALRETARLNRERTTRLSKVEAVLAEHPALVWADYAYNIGAVGGVEVWQDWNGDEYDTYEAAVDAMGTLSGNPRPVLTTKRGSTWVEKTRQGFAVSTLSDIWGKVERYGDPSPKQVEFALSLVDQMTEAEERLVAREAEHAARVAAGVAVPVTDKRIVVEGTVVGQKSVDSEWGVTFKMVVETDEGWKVYGTEPSSITPEKGDRVRFTARVERSNDDPTFGFFSRPTKAEVV